MRKANLCAILFALVVFTACEEDEVPEIKVGPEKKLEVKLEVDEELEKAAYKDAGFIYRFVLSEDKATLDKEFKFDEAKFPQLKDKKIAQKLADYVVDFIPYKYRRHVSHFYAIGEGESGNSFSGMVFHTSKKSLDRQALCVSMLTPLYISDKQEEKKWLGQTVIHEFGHTLWENNKQGVIVSDGETPPSGYEQAHDHVYIKSDGYFYRFSTEFWEKTGLLDKWSKAMDSDKMDEFYNNHKDHFVTGYAASNNNEDATESFRLFIEDDKHTGNKVKDQKVNYFYNYPELVELRKTLRAKINW